MRSVADLQRSSSSRGKEATQYSLHLHPWPQRQHWAHTTEHRGTADRQIHWSHTSDAASSRTTYGIRTGPRWRCLHPNPPRYDPGNSSVYSSDLSINLRGPSRTK